MARELTRQGQGGANAAPLIQAMQQPKFQEQLKLALPRHCTVDRFLRMMLTCVRTTPGLATCDQRSVFSCMFELASLGLEPNTPLGHAFILPYNHVAQIVIGYKGYISLADRGGVSVMAEWVYSDDEFSYGLGTTPFIKHVRAKQPSNDRVLVNAYAVAHTPTSRIPLFKVVDQSDIDAAKKSSSAYQRGQRDPNKRSSPWYTAEPPMWAKTAVRRLAPFIPMAPEYAQRFGRALELDAAADSDKDQVIDIPPALMELDLPAGDDVDTMERRLGEARAALDTVPAGTQPLGERGESDRP